MQAALRSKVLDDLRERISRIEGPTDRGPAVPGQSTGFEALNCLLAQRGLKPGTLIEWQSGSEGSGTGSLALRVAGHLLREEGICVVIDCWGEFYPPGMRALGIPLERTVIVRPRPGMTAWWAWEQSLRCPGVVLTLGWAETIDDRVYRRLQLAVEAGGGLGFLLRPAACRAATSWAATRLAVEALPSAATGRRVRVTLLRGRSEARQNFVELELNDEAGDVSVAAELADPTPPGGARSR